MGGLFAFLTVVLSAVMVLGPSPDTDGDGVLDDIDRCPQISGVERDFGCDHAVKVDSSVFVPERRRTIRINNFRPWSSPTYRQIVLIDRSEAKRWKSPSLLGRIACESGFNPGVVNSAGYAGLLQFGSIWSSMAAGVPRGVKLVTTERKVVDVVRWTEWSDGRKTRKVLRRIAQSRKVIRKGRLPRASSPLHGYWAIRVGSRAVSSTGRYPTTSWSCGL